MFVKLDLDKMHTMDGGALIVAACDKLSQSGIENFTHWSDEISAVLPRNIGAKTL